MSKSIHPLASDHLPSFITAPGETDVLMVVLGTFLVLVIFMAGLFYARLHHLPEHLAHKKVQYEIVAVLGLLAMFTHMNIFWIAALLLAMIDFPDFGGFLKRIAGSTEKIATKGGGKGVAQVAPDATVIGQREASQEQDEPARKLRSV